MALAGQSSTAVVMLVALSTQLARATQMPMQFAAMPSVMPDVTVDRLVADAQQSGLSQVTGDLLGTPLLREERFNTVQIRKREALVASRA